MSSCQSLPFHLTDHVLFTQIANDLYRHCLRQQHVRVFLILKDDLGFDTWMTTWWIENGPTHASSSFDATVSKLNVSLSFRRKSNSFSQQDTLTFTSFPLKITRFRILGLAKCWYQFWDSISFAFNWLNSFLLDKSGRKLCWWQTWFRLTWIRWSRFFSLFSFCLIAKLAAVCTRLRFLLLAVAGSWIESDSLSVCLD